MNKPLLAGSDDLSELAASAFCLWLAQPSNLGTAGKALIGVIMPMKLLQSLDLVNVDHCSPRAGASARSKLPRLFRCSLIAASWNQSRHPRHSSSTNLVADRQVLDLLLLFQGQALGHLTQSRSLLTLLDAPEPTQSCREWWQLTGLTVPCVSKQPPTT